MMWLIPGFSLVYNGGVWDQTHFILKISACQNIYSLIRAHSDSVLTFWLANQQDYRFPLKINDVT